MADQFDLCVIGAGPGGYVAAIRAAQHGLRVGLVERDEVGGVCLNRGCIPSKAMLRSAGLVQEAQHAASLGIRIENVRVDYSGVLRFRDKVVKQLTSGVTTLLQSQGVTIVKGEARLLARDRVEVRRNGEHQEIAARSIIIATGSRPAPLPIPGAQGRNVIDSDGALALTEVPRSMLIVGGGPIGVEWADIFASFGAQVTVVELLPSLIPLEDADMGRLLERVFTRRGIKVMTGARITAIEDGPDGDKRATIINQEGREEIVSAEYVLIGVGRRPNSENLGLESVGVASERGFIKVDDHLRTNVPGIYAIGDVIGGYLLAHVASREGEVAADNIAGHDARMEYKVVPACVYTHPEVASVGLTEAKAREQGYSVKVGKFPFTASGRALTAGQTDGMVKIVADAQYGEILGVHIIGHGASELIPEAALAMKLESTVEEIAATIHAHPTLAEATMEAALAVDGRAIHLPKPRR